jgi:S1-C subfamily serine protease
VNGVAVTERSLIRDAFDGVSPGDEVTVVVDRDGTSKSITVTTASQADRPAADEIPYLGARPERPMDGTGTPPTSFTVGVVDAGSPAETAGLKVGDVITSVNGTAVSDPRDAMNAVHDLAPGDTVSLGVTRDGTTLTLTATLGSQADNPNEPRGPRGGGMGDRMGGGMRGQHDGQWPAGGSPATTGGANAVADQVAGQNA